MAHDPSHEHHANVDHAAMGIEKEHPTWSTYWKVATILTLITAVEVWIYYVPAIVVLFYMHLKYDHKLFRALFTGPLIIAMTTIIALMFLFAKLVIRTG